MTAAPLAFKVQLIGLTCSVFSFGRLSNSLYGTRNNYTSIYYVPNSLQYLKMKVENNTAKEILSFKNDIIFLDLSLKSEFLYGIKTFGN